MHINENTIERLDKEYEVKTSDGGVDKVKLGAFDIERREGEDKSPYPGSTDYPVYYTLYYIKNGQRVDLLVGFEPYRNSEKINRKKLLMEEHLRSRLEDCVLSGKAIKNIVKEHFRKRR